MLSRYRSKLKNNLLIATKNKVIFGFFMAIIALFSAWAISKLVFNEIIQTVDEVSKPDEKLVLVNHIFNSVSKLDQKQKYLALNKGYDADFVKETRAIKHTLDTLAQLYDKDSLQLARLLAIRKLLSERDKQFILYLTVRDSLLNPKNFSKEIERLNNIFSERAFHSDSAVYTTESKTATTTVENNNSKGFFNKIFGKKKADSYKVVSEELKIKRDTLDQFAEDSIIRSMENSLNVIKNRQQKKSRKFIEKERSLAQASNQLTQQMLTVLEEVRTDALVQINLKGAQAKFVVNKGIRQITFILILFFVLTVLLLYLILTDISKSNKYRLALEVAKEKADDDAKAKQRFLSNMSHEIRTPLQSIVGYSEILRKNEVSPDEKAIEAIHLSASHLLHVINEILDFSRISSGKFNLRINRFELKSTLDEVLLIMKPLATNKKLALISDIAIENHLWLWGDVFRLKQILYNLLGNAIKFTTTGSVRIKLNALHQHQTAKLTIEVEDSGVGISPENLTHIFNEFDNGAKAETLDFNSTGLGLSIVKQLVELQDGEISVQSELGNGSVFSLVLSYPMAEPVLLGAALKVASIPQQITTKKVWVVDDDQLILDLCALILTQNQVSYQTFNQAKEALNSSPPENLGYVFMDIRMPEINGITLFKRLRKTLPDDVKFYAITAQVLPIEQEKILNIGFNGVIMKPFTEKYLISPLYEDLPIIKGFNAENLRKMTFGDQKQLTKILKRFAQDCLADVELLRDHLYKGECDLCGLIVHRLAGRTGQIGYKTLAYDFRKIEQALIGKDDIPRPTVTVIEEALARLQRFIKHIESKNYSI